MPLLPALESGQRLVLLGRPRDLNHGDRGAASTSGRRRGADAGRSSRRLLRGEAFEATLHRDACLLAFSLGLGRVVFLVGPALSRRLHARRLSLLLAIVRRPRRVAQALLLVARRQVEQSLERANRLVDPLVPICRLQPRRCPAPWPACSPRPLRRRPGPSAAASRLAHREAAARSTRTPRFGPWRSGCSRGRRHGALPSTTCSSRSRGRAARPREPAPSAARRTSP